MIEREDEDEELRKFYAKNPLDDSDLFFVTPGEEQIFVENFIYWAQVNR